MSFQLRGAGTRLDLDRGWLVVTWGRADRPLGQLAVPPGCCVSIRGRSVAPEGSLCLAFRFRPAGESGADVTAEIVVGPAGAERAWQFALEFAREYGVQDLSASWWDVQPSAAEREESGRDWLSAPVSPETHVLFRTVMARLTVADT
ncbi:hypothetical protein IM697_04610 [Streptomyces ferrugineus]|uniref:Uncharacterized protein n=1 Tax=Streptomyces ferrugineus TaxID=1413221 RepID=A0A7M2SMX1_9ACTN|nr:hypothetical protein [Streptomyces ferrugineus]QOV37710.1 hypothetical protein IM697_04610 [Streptomyces ferrugineus]